MTRSVLPNDRIDDAIRQKMNTEYADSVNEVVAAVENEPLVMIGMEYNPHVARARKALEKAGVAYKYLGYGGYTSEWRRRSALKMWSGWQSFPQVFVKSTLVGGADGITALIESGALEQRLED